MSDNFANERAKRVVGIMGRVIVIAITLLSSLSSFMIYREGFKDLAPILQNLLSFFPVIAVEGAFIYMLIGFTRAFSSFLERMISFGGMWAIVGVMLINIVTHFMMVKGIPLNEFQQAWIGWGAVAVFVGVLIVVLAIILSDPAIRLTMLDLRIQGTQQETLLRAKRSALRSKRVQAAMAKLADTEAEKLARRIEAGSNAEGELGADHLWHRTDGRWTLEKSGQSAL